MTHKLRVWGLDVYVMYRRLVDARIREHARYCHDCNSAGIQLTPYPAFEWHIPREEKE